MTGRAKSTTGMPLSPSTLRLAEVANRRAAGAQARTRAAAVLRLHHAAPLSFVTTGTMRRANGETFSFVTKAGATTVMVTARQDKEVLPPVPAWDDAPATAAADGLTLTVQPPRVTLSALSQLSGGLDGVVESGKKPFAVFTFAVQWSGSDAGGAPFEFSERFSYAKRKHELAQREQPAAFSDVAFPPTHWARNTNRSPDMILARGAELANYFQAMVNRASKASDSGARECMTKLYSIPWPVGPLSATSPSQPLRMVPGWLDVVSQSHQHITAGEISFAIGVVKSSGYPFQLPTRRGGWRHTQQRASVCESSSGHG
jgi:hypothetical protein